MSRHDAGRGERHSRRRSPRRKSGVGSLILGVLLLLIGAGVLFYPIVLDVTERDQASEAIEDMRTGSIGDATATLVEGDDGITYRSKEGDAAYSELVAYNEAVREGTGDTINDPFAFQADELESFDLPDGIIGTVSIPKLGVKMTLYLGATTENLKHGAGIIAGTSLPLGEDSSNTVIAAHRGGQYGRLRNIEDLETGDQVIVETPWDKLVYTVTSTETILPTETDAAGLRVEEGRDMVTLYTCHPYGISSHRLLVHCDYDSDATAEADATPLEGALRSFLPRSWSSESTLLNVEAVLKVIALVLLLVGALLLLSDAVRSIRRRNHGHDDPAPPPHGSHFSSA